MLISTSLLEGEISNLYIFYKTSSVFQKEKIQGLMRCKVQLSKNINFFTSSDQDSIHLVTSFKILH